MKQKIIAVLAVFGLVGALSACSVSPDEAGVQECGHASQIKQELVIPNSRSVAQHIGYKVLPGNVVEITCKSGHKAWREVE